MKKFAMAVATASLLGGAYAESCASSMSGFYAGVQAGVNSTNGSLKMDNALTSTAAADTSSRNVNIGKKSFMGGIFAGYGMGVGSCAYVGGELFVNFGNTSSTLVDQTNEGLADAKIFKVKMERQYTIGAKVRLGYTVSQQAMIFVGLGLESAKLKLQNENIQTAVAQTGVDATTKKSSRKISFAPSVGMDMFLNKNLFVRGEYTYVVGLKQKVSPTIRQAAAVTKQAEIKANATQQRFALGLGYKF